MNPCPTVTFLVRKCLKRHIVGLTVSNEIILESYQLCRKCASKPKQDFQFANILNDNSSWVQQFPYDHIQITTVMQKMCLSTQTDGFSVRKWIRKCLVKSTVFLFSFLKHEYWAPHRPLTICPYRLHSLRCTLEGTHMLTHCIFLDTSERKWWCKNQISYAENAQQCLNWRFLG